MGRRGPGDGEACAGQTEAGGRGAQPPGEKAGAQHEWERESVAWIPVV